MILAAVDDLMFSSKIRTVARQVGAEVTFARSSAAVLEAARARRPSLVIFDLDSQRTDPVATIAQLRSDEAFTDLPILGFVSHVHTDRIEAARRAGSDEVLPRSAFTANLAAILQRGM